MTTESVCGFNVNYVSMDGANANRTVMKIHLSPKQILETASVVSPYNPNKRVQLVMDYKIDTMS